MGMLTLRISARAGLGVDVGGELPPQLPYGVWATSSYAEDA
jgi:hypothetical protein